MPNGGSDCCAFCRFNTAHMDEVRREREQEPEDYCTVRDLPITRPGFTYCVNHPGHNPQGIRVPVGPEFEAYSTMGGRYITVKSPDSEEVRSTLLALLHDIHDQPGSEYPSSTSFDDVVIWQVGEFLEKRALDDLWRMAGFDKTIQAADKRVARKVALAEDAILKIHCQDAPARLGQLWYWGLDRLNS